MKFVLISQEELKVPSYVKHMKDKGIPYTQSHRGICDARA